MKGLKAIPHHFKVVLDKEPTYKCEMLGVQLASTVVKILVSCAMAIKGASPKYRELLI